MSNAKQAVKVIQQMFMVSGEFLIPGSREKGSFGPQLVIDENRTKCSAALAPLLNDKFSKELTQANRQAVGNPHRFSRDFALMHLRWVPFAGKAPAKIEAVIEPGLPIAEVLTVVDDRNDPPAL
jgi:hypothetical protein